MTLIVPNLPALGVPRPRPDGIEISDLLKVLWRHRIPMSLVFLSVFTIGYWVVSNLDARYTASATLILEVTNSQPVDLESVAGGLNKDAALINSEMDVLRSSGLSEQVVDKLGLTGDPEFNALLRPVQPGLLARTGLLEILPEPLSGWLASKEPDRVSPERERAMVIASVLSSLRVENDGESYTIHLYFEADSPTIAAAVANAFADLYLVSRLQGKYEATARAGQWVKGKLDELRRQVTAADRAVQEFREQHQLIDIAEGTLTDRQLATLSAELAAASASRARRESALEEIRRSSGSDRRSTTAEIAGSPLVQELRSQQNLLHAQRAELESEYGFRHPRILEIESRLREAQERLDQESERALAELETGVRVARTEERALTDQLEELKARSALADRAAIELRQLTSEADAARVLFDAFVQGLSRTSAEVGVSEPDARILSRAAPPLFASYPPRTLLMLLTALSSVLVALVAAAILEVTAKGFRDPADLERTHGFPVLGLIPLTPLRGVGHQHPSVNVIERPLSRFTEAVQSVCVTLGYSQADQPSRVALITSSAPDEGKTAFAIALGRLAACNGRRVLLIDCDLRRPSVGRDLGQPSAQGLVELSVGRISIEQALRFDKPSGMAFVPASKGVSYPAEVCSSERLCNLIEQARQVFDLIILDSPPIGLVSDALALSRMADATLLTVRWGKTPRPAVAAAVKKLAAAGSPVTAAVFSHVDLKRCASYGYYPLTSSDDYFSDLEVPAAGGSPVRMTRRSYRTS